MNRRQMLQKMALAGLVLPFPNFSVAHGAKPAKRLRLAGLRGALDATKFGVRPDAHDDQSQLIQNVLDKGAALNKPVFLPPGTYVVSNIDLPSRTRLIGISGTSRLVYGGGGAMLSGTGCELIDINGVAFDGANRAFGDEFGGLLHARACPRVQIDNCEFIGSMATGISLEACGGRVERSRISGANGLAALFSVNATGLSIQNNTVSDCANGGILVHRWTVGRDNTVITGNRVERIAAKGGGTGQRGNGINLFRTHGVLIANNHINTCAFSAIRANSASNVQITANTCLNSGETAIYSEFEFEGSLITNNIVDGGTMGISIANFDKGGRLAVCANNLVRNMVTTGPYPAENSGFGVGIYAEADTSLTGNVVEGAPKYGILLGWGPYLRNLVAANNVIRDAGEGIAVSVVKGSGSVLLSGNIISEVKKGGIIGHEWTKSVTGELVGKSARKYPHLTLRNNVLD